MNESLSPGSTYDRTCTAALRLGDVTNQIFMQAVFHSAERDAFAWVCSLSGDPKVSRSWLGKSCRPHNIPPMDEGCNTFFNISTLKAVGGRVDRTESNFAALHVVVLDDIGTKAALPEGFAPSYLLETSDGNFQAGLILETPCADLGQVKALFKALALKGLTDKGAQGPQSRYVRLPVGINQKPKCGPEGFKHRLAIFEPQRRFTVGGIVQAFGLSLDEASTATPTVPKSTPTNGVGRSATPATGHMVDTIVMASVLRSAKARRVWEGDDSSFGSGSDADQYLLNMLAFKTQDREQVERIYSMSGRAGRKSSDGTCKWKDRADYRERSVSAAFKFVEDHPDGDADEARSIVEAAVTAAALSADPRGVYSADVLNAFGVLAKSDAGSFDYFRTAAKKAGVTLSTLDAEIVKSRDEGAKLLDADAADLAIERLGGMGSVLNSKGQWWRWRQELGIWARSEGDEPIKQAIHSVLPKRQITGGVVASVLSVLRTKVAQTVEFDRDLGTYVVNCANGTLHLTAKTFDEGMKSGFWELRPHRREDYLTARVPVPWTPDALCPVFDAFLDSILAGDADADEKRQVLVQGIGYSLMPVTDQEKFFVLYGPTASNGKSTLLAVIEGLAGVENTSALSLKQLGERFAPAKLHGKLVNLCAEIPRGEVLPDDQIKRLASGDMMTAEFKGKDHFEFRNRATLWFACNDLPNLRDLSTATLEKRCILIQLNNSFSGETRDVRLKVKLLAELEGIFFQCVEYAGAMSVLSSEVQGFTITGGRDVAAGYYGGFLADPPSSVAAKAEWRVASDPVSLFAGERLVAGAGHFVEGAALFAAYSAWAETNGVKSSLTSHHLTGRLKRQFPTIETGDSARRGGKRGIVGLALVDE